MKLVKSLLLGSAAGLAAVAGAQAADLPARAAPVAVEYVRVCSVHGAGFFYIPGSDTCLRIGGYVRAEYQYREPFFRAQDATGFFARGRLAVDARTATEFGTVRAFIRYDIQRQSGPYNAVGPFGGAPSNVASVNRAFVQFAGLTAGRNQSFFDFYANDNNFSALFTSDRVTSMLAYTATFGGGFSATVSLEDGLERRTLAATLPAGIPGATLLTPGGQRLPDVVGVLRLEQAWGTAQLSGALHEVRAANVVTPLGGVPDVADTEYGFAVQGGVKINMPFTGPGDALYLQAAYARGAQDYLTAGALGTGFTTGFLTAVTPTGGTAFVLPQTDAVIDVFGNTKLSDGWSINVDWLHYWTPTIRSNVLFSYLDINYPGAASGFVATPGGTFATGFVDTTAFRVGGNIIWSPVRNLDLGLEVLYTKVDPRGRVFVATGAGGAPITVGSEDFWEGRLRIQRDF